MTEQQPGKVSIEDGLIILEGSDATAVTMTPEVAMTTGESLLGAGAEALAARAERDEEPIR